MSGSSEQIHGTLFYRFVDSYVVARIPKTQAAYVITSRK